MGTECFQVPQCDCGLKEKGYTSGGGVWKARGSQTDPISATPLSPSLGAGPQPNLHISYLP